MTLKKKRKYGDLASRTVSSDPDIIADVYAAFTGRRPAQRDDVEVPLEEKREEANSKPLPSIGTAPTKQTKHHQQQVVPRDGIPHKSIPSRGIPQNDIPPQDTPRFLELIKEERGYYPTFNDISDRLVPELKLDAYEQVLLFRLYRLSRGWQKDTCVVGHTKLSNSLNLSRSTVQKTIARLIEKRLIEHVSEKGNDGTEYRILPGIPVLQRGIPRDGIPPQKKGGISDGIRRSNGIPPDGHIKNSIKDFKNKDKEERKISRLTPEEKIETLQMIADLITKDGYSFEQAETQFGGNLTQEDWTAIRAQVQGYEK